MRYSSTAVEFPKQGYKTQRIDCNTQMSNVIESSREKEPAATPNRSRAPFQGDFEYFKFL